MTVAKTSINPQDFYNQIHALGLRDQDDTIYCDCGEDWKVIYTAAGLKRLAKEIGEHADDLGCDYAKKARAKNAPRKRPANAVRQPAPVTVTKTTPAKPATVPAKTASKPAAAKAAPAKAVAKPAEKPVSLWDDDTTLVDAHAAMLAYQATRFDTKRTDTTYHVVKTGTPLWAHAKKDIYQVILGVRTKVIARGDWFLFYDLGYNEKSKKSGCFMQRQNGDTVPLFDSEMDNFTYHSCFAN